MWIVVHFGRERMIKFIWIKFGSLDWTMLRVTAFHIFFTQNILANIMKLFEWLSNKPFSVASMKFTGSSA